MVGHLEKNQIETAIGVKLNYFWNLCLSTMKCSTCFSVLIINQVLEIGPQNRL